MRINLKKILLKKDVSSVLNELNNVINSQITIQDEKGNILFEKKNGTTGNNKYPIKLVNRIIGWVTGDSTVSSISAFLTCFAGTEFEKKKLAAETLEKYKELAVLYDTSEKIASCLESKEVAGLIIDEAKKIITLDNISVMLLRDDTGQLETICGTGSTRKSAGTGKEGNGIADCILKSGNAEIVNNVRNDSRFVEGDYKISSMMSVPLKIKDKSLGVINVSCENQFIYSARELKLLMALASQAAVAIENAKLYEKLKETFVTTIYTLAETIEKRDPYTGGHTRRVAKYSQILGQRINISNNDSNRLELAAVLHDIGKIGISDKILLKKGRLTDEEFAEIKKHTVFGEEILNHIDQLKDIIPGVRQHHERYGGGGYPDNLRGENISIIARIIAVADTFDAMMSDRPYRKGLELETTLEELKNIAGRQLDPDLVMAFIDAYNTGLLTEIK